MLFDIGLAVFGFLAQFLTAWLGWRVTVDGVKPERRRLYEALFIVGGAIGAISIGVATYRANGVANDLAAIKSAQQNQGAGISRLERNAEHPTVAVTIPPAIPQKEHTRIGFVSPFPTPQPLLPYHKDETPAINIGYRNDGDFSVRDIKTDAKVLLVPTVGGKIPNDVFRSHKNLLKPTMGGGVLTPHRDDLLFHTFYGQPLTEDDVKGLNKGEQVLCGISVVDWLDDSGRYETSFCQCFAPEGSGNFNWHVLPENNAERKR